MRIEIPGLSQKRKEVSFRKNACHGKELLEALMDETGRGRYISSFILRTLSVIRGICMMTEPA
jgi:hypothetical protein